MRAVQLCATSVPALPCCHANERVGTNHLVSVGERCGTAGLKPSLRICATSRQSACDQRQPQQEGAPPANTTTAASSDAVLISASAEGVHTHRVVAWPNICGTHLAIDCDGDVMPRRTTAYSEDRGVKRRASAAAADPVSRADTGDESAPSEFRNSRHEQAPQTRCAPHSASQIHSVKVSTGLRSRIIKQKHLYSPLA
jgi:hypothetical protein